MWVWRVPRLPDQKGCQYLCMMLLFISKSRNVSLSTNNINKYARSVSNVENLTIIVMRQSVASYSASLNYNVINGKFFCFSGKRSASNHIEKA